MKQGLFVIATVGALCLAACSMILPESAAPTASIVNGTVWQLTDGTVQGSHTPAFKVGDTYYSYGGDGGSGGGGFKGFYCYSSTDLTNWTTRGQVLAQTTDPELYSCKLESLTVVYNLATKKYVMWMHYENATDYSLARVLVASCDSPDGAFKLTRGSFRPDGVTVSGKRTALESRDLSVFVDKDQKAYLISLSNAGGGSNADLIIYRLTADYLGIDTQLCIASYGKSRGAPSMTRSGDYYYLFTSATPLPNPGWYPSQAKYSFATSMAGPWSDLQPLADSSGFNGENGGVVVIHGSETTNRLIALNRRIPGGKGLAGSTPVWVPLTLNGPVASIEYMDRLDLNLSSGAITNKAYGVLLSQGQPASASSASPYHPASGANDGDYASMWSANSPAWTPTPWWSVDLGASHEIRNVQVSWWIAAGAEAYYQYLIQTSNDGVSWSTAFDSTGRMVYGFTSDDLPAGTTGRYVRVWMNGAVLYNNPTNTYTPKLWEVKVYGN